MPGMHPAQFQHFMPPEINSPVQPRPLFGYHPYPQGGSPTGRPSIPGLTHQGSFDFRSPTPSPTPHAREHDNQLPSPSFPPLSPAVRSQASLTPTEAETQVAAEVTVIADTPEKPEPVAAASEPPQQALHEQPEPVAPAPEPEQPAKAETQVEADSQPASEPAETQNLKPEATASEQPEHGQEPAKALQPQERKVNNDKAQEQLQETRVEKLEEQKAAEPEKETATEPPASAVAPTSSNKQTITHAIARGMKARPFATPKATPKSIYDGGLYWKILVCICGATVHTSG